MRGRPHLPEFAIDDGLNRDVADDVATELTDPRLKLAGTAKEVLRVAVRRPAERVLRLRLLPGENVDQRRKVLVPPTTDSSVGHLSSLGAGSHGQPESRSAASPGLTSYR